MNNMEQLARQRSEFWNFGGTIVYVALAMLAMAPVVIWCRSDTATLIGTLAAMFGPAVFVAAMMHLRHVQYMRILDAEIEELSR